MSRLSFLKHSSPKALRKTLSTFQRHWRRLVRWTKILLGGTPRVGTVFVSYGLESIPGPGENAGAHLVVFQRMQHLFPHSPRRYNILYLGSTSIPKDWPQLLWLTQHKKARILYNQNGVAYPAWHGPGWEETNKPMRDVLHAADFVFYQSRFCKLSADRFLGERSGPWAILPNAVDTGFFTPAPRDPDPKHLIVLLGGLQYLYYSFELALKAFALAAQKRRGMRLVITGRLKWLADEAEAHQMARKLIAELGVADRVELSGPYVQQNAPEVFRQAHLLLHPRVNDACPSTVIEAMACGLPVVYSQSGGVPELVGPDAGIGVPTLLDWERIHLPDPHHLADAILSVAEQRLVYAEAARQRAVERLDLQPWLQRHVEVIEQLLQQNKAFAPNLKCDQIPLAMEQI